MLTSLNWYCQIEFGITEPHLSPLFAGGRNFELPQILAHHLMAAECPREDVIFSLGCPKRHDLRKIHSRYQRSRKQPGRCPENGFFSETRPCYKTGMKNEVGRNQPCPCGSGHKYKNCCYRRDAEAAQSRGQTYPDPEWQRIRKTEGDIIDAVGSFARRRFGEDLTARAWLEFSAGSTIPKEPLTVSLFVPWFIFSWLPSSASRPPFQSEPLPQPLALTYLAKHRADLDDFQKSFIQAACGEPFSFFIVTAVEQHRSLALRDLLLEREVTVKERQASELLRRGNVIYARSVSLAGQSILQGIGPVPLPPDIQSSIIDLRSELKNTARSKGPLSPAFLRSQDGFLRSFYFEAADRALNPPPPVLQNTDGDPLVSIRLRYKLHCTPEQALEKLKSLVLAEYQDRILDHADFDGSGNLARVTLTWQKKGNRLNPGWDNTSLGSIEIRGGSVVIEVNSENRATKIRRDIRDRLGKQCTFMKEERKSIEALLQAQTGHGGIRKQQRSREDEAMSPEVCAAVAEMMKAHWEAWLDSPIPALRDQTPRQAARTPEGRERLEALLMAFEYRNESMIQPELRPDVGELRRKLGLPE
jgi:hypothetical protein